MKCFFIVSEDTACMYVMEAEVNISVFPPYVVF